MKNKLGRSTSRRGTQVAPVCCSLGALTRQDLCWKRFTLFQALLQSKTVQVLDKDGPEPPGHVKKRLTKKLHFLDRVADSKHKALAATAGIKKKPHKSKSRQKKALPDLNSLAELLAEVDQKQQKQAAKQEQHGAVQTNKQKGRTEQINGSKARRNVTYALFHPVVARFQAAGHPVKLLPRFVPS